MFNKTNLLIVGVTLLVLFTVAVWLVGMKIDSTANRMHRSMEKEMGNYRSELVKQDFRQTEELVRSTQQYLEKNGYRKEVLPGFLSRLVGLDAKVTRAWYLCSNEGMICEENQEAKPAGSELRQKLRQVSDSLNRGKSRLYQSEGVTYWSLCGYCGEVVFGFDVSLPALHSYFARMTPTVRSYAFITNADGILITHPDEKRVGSLLSSPEELEKIAQAIRSGKPIPSSCFSRFLLMPVERVYYPIPVGDEKWVVAVNILQLENQEEMNDFNRYTLLIGLITVFIFALLLGFSQYKWQKEYDLRRKAERQALILNIQQLKNQINPHFLFNSFNSLSVLIGTNNALAKEFLLKLSKVFRYLLETRHENLTTVASELEFARQYYFLQQIRFGKQLTLDDSVDATVNERKIPVMSLQMLIENAIKHNEITKEHPLHIKIDAVGEYIVVTNNYQPRTDAGTDSFGIGFDMLHEIYKFYTKKNFEYQIEGDTFVCKLPLI